MPGEGPPLPSRFPCMCKAIYSWGGETKRDLGFVEGDLIECLNAGDGQWWMGRLKRNKTVGLFPSNFVEILEDHPPRPVSRAASPMYGHGGGRISRAASPAPSHYSRAASPQPSMHDYYERGGSGRGRASRAPSPYDHGHISRAASPNPYMRAASPAPSMRGDYIPRAVSPAPSMRGDYIPRAVSPAPSMRPEHIARAVSPAPSQFRAASPNPSMMHYHRAPSPNPYATAGYAEATPPPPAPPPHRYHPSRPTTPLAPPDGRRTPIPSRGPSPSIMGQTPSPLRNAMDDVMESLQHMTARDERPRTPQDPWSPAAFGQEYQQSPRKGYVRPETSLGIAGRNEYEDEDDDNGVPFYHRPPSAANYVDRMEDALTDFRPPPHRHVSDESPPRNSDMRPKTGEPALRSRKSAYDLRQQQSPSPNKMFRPKLLRTTTIGSNSTSNNSSATTSTASTAPTSASIMSGMSAGGFSATSAGSLARRKKAVSIIGAPGLGSPKLGNGRFGRAETPSGYLGSNSGSGSGHRRQQTWGGSEDGGEIGVLGGLATPKPKKKGFFKKILNSAKTSAASARSIASASSTSLPAQYAPKAIPDGVTAIAGGRQSMGPQQTQDWVQVRRDVNRSNTLSRNERIERQEKQQMMDQIVLRPVDALDEDVDGDEAADGGIVENPQDFDKANLALVDKAARFISSLPPFTTPESLASHHVCRPYRSDVQRLRAIFTWIAEKIAWEHPTGPIDGELGDGVDTRRVLAQKRGSPEEIAVVVQGMCGAVGIHCEVVRGYLKAPGEHIDVEAFPRPNHFWNSVVVDGEWRLMDCSLASATHPRRGLYSSAPGTQPEFFYFLTKPSHLCWSHVPIDQRQQHMVPPLPMPMLLALPCACPPFFRNGLQMINFDTSLTRIEDLEVVQIEFSVPVDIECVAVVETNGFAIDQDGDVFESGEVIKKRALCQVAWESGVKTFRVKAVLPGDEGTGVLKVYAGKRGLMHSIRDNPHPLAFALPITHTGENPPYDFLVRHPTPHAQRHDLYISQPQCHKLAMNNTFVFAVRQAPSEGMMSAATLANTVMAKPAKLGIQTPSGKILRLIRKADTVGCENGMTWETIIKCGERGPWRALVLADRTARWCVYAEWLVV